MSYFIVPGANPPNNAASVPGITIPTGGLVEICWNCWGPVIQGEWWIAATGSGAVGIAVIELLWDSPPCDEFRHGVADTIVTTRSFNGPPIRILKAEPRRYGIIFAG